MYASYVKETIEAAADQWGSFTGPDIQSLNQVVTGLNEAEVTLVSRMAMRTKAWLRTEQLTKYVKDSACISNLDMVVNSRLADLSRKDVVDVLESNNSSPLWGHDLNDAWDILWDVLMSDEWRAMYKLLKLPLESGSKRKELLVNDIKRSFQQQKPLFGTNHSKLYSILSKVLGPSVRIVRLKPFILQTFRRAQRLSMICSASSGNGDISVHAPVPLNVPLLARFGRLRFPVYRIFSSTPMFPSERAFCQYEASCELFVAAELSQIIAKLAGSGVVASTSGSSSSSGAYTNTAGGIVNFELIKLMKRLATTISESVIPFFAPIALFLPCASSTVSTDSRILKFGLDASGAFSVREVSTLLMSHFLSAAGCPMPIESSSSVYSFCKNVSLEASVSIVGTLCFMSYLLETYYLSTHDPTLQTQRSSRPEFFASLDAGQKLTSLCSIAINELEKQTCGCYSLATSLLQLLLAAQTPFVRYRRGRWLNRLCVDLEHMHTQQVKATGNMGGLYMLQIVAASCSAVYADVTKDTGSIFLLLSLTYAKAAMMDPSVRSGEKILFEKRIAKLTSRLFGPSLDSASEVHGLLQLASSDALALLNCPLFLLQRSVLQLSILLQAATRQRTFTLQASDAARYFSIFVAKSLFDQLEVIFPFCKALSRSHRESSSPIAKEEVVSMERESFVPTIFWVCEMCTFRNNEILHTAFCAMCQSKRSTLSHPSVSSIGGGSADVIVIDDDDDDDNGQAVKATSGTVDAVVVLDSDDDNDEGVAPDSTLISQSEPAIKLNPQLFATFSLTDISEVTASLNDSLSDNISDDGNGAGESDETSEEDSSIDRPKYLFSDDLVLMGLEPVNEAALGDSSQYSTEQQLLVRAINALDEKQVESHATFQQSGPFAPQSFTIFGRRFGNTTNAKGKSRFVGSNDTICNVEQYVLAQCYQGDTDTSPEFSEAIRGFGWQGWHCEGSCVRSLFALLMWEAVFSDQPDVFQTPYQDAPLDMGYPSFCRSRLPVIYKLLGSLFHASGAELVARVGSSYREHRGQECRGMSWSYSMHTLQLLAVCIGGRVLAHIFRALCVNRKYLGSGFPDLVLVRVRSAATNTPVDLSTLLGEKWSASYLADGDTVAQRGLVGDDLFNLTDSKPKPKRAKVDSPEAGVAGDTVQTTEPNTELDDDSPSIEVDDINVPSELIDDRDMELDIELPGVTSENDCHIYEAMFVEVKGPNDKLAAHQILWQRILNSAGAHVFVGHVTEVESG